MFFNLMSGTDNIFSRRAQLVSVTAVLGMFVLRGSFGYTVVIERIRVIFM